MTFVKTVRVGGAPGGHAQRNGSEPARKGILARIFHGADHGCNISKEFVNKELGAAAVARQDRRSRLKDLHGFIPYSDSTRATVASRQYRCGGTSYGQHGSTQVVSRCP